MTGSGYDPDPDGRLNLDVDNAPGLRFRISPGEKEKPFSRSNDEADCRQLFYPLIQYL